MLIRFAAILAFGSVLALPAGAEEVAGHGKIIVFRSPSIMGYAVACPIRIDGQEVAELGRGKYVELDVPAGRTLLTNKTSSLEVNVDPGETRYVRCKIGGGTFVQNASFLLVDQATFEAKADKLDRKEPGAK